MSGGWSILRDREDRSVASLAGDILDGDFLSVTGREADVSVHFHGFVLSSDVLKLSGLAAGDAVTGLETENTKLFYWLKVVLKLNASASKVEGEGFDANSTGAKGEHALQPARSFVCSDHVGEHEN